MKETNPMAQTLVEQIISHAAGRPVRAGELVVVPVDLAMAVDSIAPSIIRILREDLGMERVMDPDRVAIVIDHVAPPSTVAVAEEASDDGIFEALCRLALVTPAGRR
jgi:methanogen homoaconitase large subunit